MSVNIKQLSRDADRAIDDADLAGAELAAVFLRVHWPRVLHELRKLEKLENGDQETRA